MTKLEELRAAYEAATQEQAASLEAGVAMQAKLLDFGELAHSLMPALLEAVGAMHDVLRISDRKHEAWDRAYAALEKLK